MKPSTGQLAMLGIILLSEGIDARHGLSSEGAPRAHWFKMLICLVDITSLYTSGRKHVDAASIQ